MREVQALVAPNPPQQVLARGQAGLVTNKLSPNFDDILAWQVRAKDAEAEFEALTAELRSSEKVTTSLTP